MSWPVYSAIIVAPQHLAGHSETQQVPEGRTYVVRQLTAYANPIAGQTSVFFEDVLSGAALWSAFFDLDHGGWQGFYGHIVLPAGSQYRFYVNAAGDNQADVAAFGYDLSGPA